MPLAKVLAEEGLRGGRPQALPLLARKFFLWRDRPVGENGLELEV